MHEKTKIIKTARGIYLKRGFHKVSVDVLAEQLRMSKKTIYKHFSSKEDIVWHTAWDFINEHFKELPPIINSHHNAIEKMNRVLALLSKITLQLSDVWLYDIKNYYPELWEEIDTFRRKNIFNSISTILEQGQREGVYRKIPSDILIAAFTGTLQNIVSPAFILEHGYSFQEVILHTFDLFFNGVTTEKGRKLTKHIKPE